MRWVGLTYSLPSGSASSRRVAVWRRLRQIGAISPTGSLWLLPAGEANQEAVDWLAQEIEDGGGEALAVQIDELEAGAEDRLVAAFRGARDEDYRKLAAEADELSGQADAGDREALRDRLEKLRKRHTEVSRIDFFAAPEAPRAAAALARLEEVLGRGGLAARPISAADPARYRGRRWVTRPRPHVDRLASAWLIRRFIDPEAEIRYGEVAEPGEVSFDMRGAEFGHSGNLCTFETLLAAFGLDDPALAAMAAIVHEIDLRDGATAAPEVAGIYGVLRGWSQAGWPDAELERHGVALFEGLYTAFRTQPSLPREVSAEGSTRRSKRRPGGTKR